MKGCISGPARWKRCIRHSYVRRGAELPHSRERTYHSPTSPRLWPQAPAQLFCIRCQLLCTGKLVPWTFQPHSSPTFTRRPRNPVTKYWHTGRALQQGGQGRGATHIFAHSQVFKKAWLQGLRKQRLVHRSPNTGFGTLRTHVLLSHRW